MRAATCFLALGALVSHVFAGKMKYLGVAMAGIDFGCDIDGSCPTKTASVPLKEYNGGDGAAQMKYFAEKDGLNVFRLSATWQFLLNNNLGGKLDETNFGSYDKLVQACLITGAYCMIDMHNFARYNGGIIGQGGPADEVFVDIWQQIASNYSKEEKIIFGVMNEPHDLDVNIWAKTVQKAVTGIRKAGATSQMILLPATNFASVETYVSTGSADALAAITNPDGSTDSLYFDVHKYLDINNSGSHTLCTTNNVDAFNNFADWLRKNKRQAIISETGASMDPSCMIDFCEQNEAIANNSDVYIGFVGWGAGSFDDTYILTLTPLGSNPADYTDNKLMKQCILAKFSVDEADKPQAQTSSASTSSSKPSSTGSSPKSSSKPIFAEQTTVSAPTTSTTAPSADTDSTNSKKNGAARSVEVFAGAFALAFAASCYSWLL